MTFSFIFSGFAVGGCAVIMQIFFRRKMLAWINPHPERQLKGNALTTVAAKLIF
jgi:hypothetical protein